MAKEKAIFKEMRDNPELLSQYTDPDGVFIPKALYSAQEHRIPIHTLVWRGDAASKRAAAANVEQTNSRASTLFADFHAGTLSAKVTEMMMFVHVNSKIPCLMPTVDQVCARYMEKFTTIERMLMLK